MSCSSGSCGTIYSKKRYIVYSIITLIALTLPFIRINGNHFFLLSFDKKQLHLLFTAFDMQELYLMPFLLIMLFLGIFFLTTLGGRIWCGWSCPQTIFRVIYRDLIQTKIFKIRKSTKNKQQEPTGNSLKKLLAFLTWVVLALIAASNFLWYFIPPEDFFAYLSNPTNHFVLIGFLTAITAFLVYDVTSLQEEFCVYICPYARVQSVMYDEDTIQTIYNEKRGGVIYDNKGNMISTKPTGENDECTGCEACVRICPTHIDIRKGMQLECINCLECADACTNVMGKLGKKSLITWTSPNEVVKGDRTHFLRFRTIAYGIAICIAFVALILMGSNKEYMLLNINRTSELYKIKDHGKTVENDYTFLFQNTDSKEHTYYFEVLTDGIKIKKPTKPFVLVGGEKNKEVVSLVANSSLAPNQTENEPTPIKIKAFAIDEKDKIVVFRDTTFIYPSKNAIAKEAAKQ
jgi:cytochrome c oxidase accessory protein FixG